MTGGRPDKAVSFIDYSLDLPFRHASPLRSAILILATPNEHGALGDRALP